MYVEDGFFVSYAKLEKVYRKMCARAVAEYRLTPNEIVVLMFLSNNPTHDTAKDIAHYKDISKGLVAKSVDLLCRRGLLQQERDENDRRLIHLRLCEDSGWITSRLRSCREAFSERLYRGLPEDYPERLQKTVAPMIENIEEMLRGFDT